MPSSSCGPSLNCSDDGVAALLWDTVMLYTKPIVHTTEY
uniref:Uncharacterized protein n=1 Tax=Arundo donax TaxID=35708 RepID=A0A0A9EFM6_ARUDO